MTELLAGMMPQPEPDDKTCERTAAPYALTFAAVPAGFRMGSDSAAIPESAPESGILFECVPYISDDRNQQKISCLSHEKDRDSGYFSLNQLDFSSNLCFPLI
jgi:hypothetical protein